MEKTKAMIFGKDTTNKMIEVRREKIENVKLVYLASLLTWDNDCAMDIKVRIVKQKDVYLGSLFTWDND